ncbi:MAG TPA: GatB/YqeY domain-containing protein [Candidatus Nealsonbacteria bacterium]|uniref:GatB/YqeY domain-containing protein n=1 Tax=marine sediment metagenome TaxID=412755 RepID=A0A0F9V155_9ZZZZ|nr:GatB/YqeY domain-containing protein [Candidatus Nealsonbacteria bacterium]HEB46447.1 GatB/YqeY domain-containing protein [Candidatus Nealsonbacteria bacterium]
MSIKEEITINLKEYLKEKKETEVSVLRQLLAEILNKEKEKRNRLAKKKKEINEEELKKESQLTEEEIIEAVFSETKKRKEAIAGFQKGEREDLAEKEQKELEILKKYLPEQLSKEEIKKLAKETIDRIGASGQKDMGKVIGELIPKVKGKAEGSLISQIVKELLAP